MDTADTIGVAFVAPPRGPQPTRRLIFDVHICIIFKA